jgi:hypothetical protein
LLFCYDTNVANDHDADAVGTRQLHWPNAQLIDGKCGHKGTGANAKFIFRLQRRYESASKKCRSMMNKEKITGQ